MKKLLSILITAAIACTLTACGNDNGEQVSEETVAVTEMKTIEPPEDGWTLEELAESICINGQNFSYPCSIENLSQVNYGEDIKINDDNTISAVLQYDETIAATVVLNNCESYSDIEPHTHINSFCSSTVLDIEPNANSKLLTVNGISTYMTKEQAISHLGIPDIDNDIYYTYVERKTGEEILTISFENELIVGIFVYL